MSSHRFFMETSLPSSVAPGDEVLAPLSAADLHRAARTARLAEGERIILVESGHAAWECDVVSVTPEALKVAVAGRRELHHEPNVTLFAGVTKGHKMDLTVEKSVEVGVSGIVPVMCERSIVRWDDAKAAERTMRWQRVASAAAAQAQRSFIPEVSTPRTFEQVLGEVSEYDRFVVAWVESGRSDLPQVMESLPSKARLGIFVGPEGGLSGEEAEALEEAGAHCVGLGAHILRSETAGIVLAALTVYEMGGLGGRSRG